MRIHQSAEDYLEKILMIREKKGEVHSIDIANELGVFEAERERGHEEPSPGRVYLDGRQRRDHPGTPRVRDRQPDLPAATSC